jgi:hypothetical protein
VENIVKDLNNMLMRFYFLKERKNRTQEQMTDSQVKAVTEFAIFVKTLTEKVCSLLYRLQENQTFEEKIDEEIKQLETYVKKRIKEYDEVLEDALIGKGRMLIKRLAKRVGNVISGVAKPSRGERLVMKSRDEMEGVCQRCSPAKMVILESPEVQRRDSRQLWGNHLRIQKRN